MFQNFPTLPLDPIFQLQADYLNDPNPNKVNLGIGLYANEQGNPVVLNTVKKAFSEVDTTDFNYQPISGNRTYLNLTAKLILPNTKTEKLAMQATCGGTQALRLFADMVKKEAKEQDYTPTLLIGTPTWGNHLAIFNDFNTIKFNHLNPQNLACFDSHKNALETAPDNSVLLLHSGKTHNPTGQNLSLSELISLADIINQKKIKVLIDSAYFGFGDTIEKESEWLSTLSFKFNNFAVAFSYSKNASLYEHRTGALFIKTENKSAVESNLQQLMRESVSMAPGLGQEIMINILQNYLLEWLSEVDEIRAQLNQKRKLLADNLPSNFSHISESAGMFALAPFSPEQIKTIQQEDAIYFPSNGRLNLAGINQSNLDYIIDSFKKSF
jgi:aspartate/tyrosine/aromatic aminotransferase